jgi:hypothetical protein
MGTRSQRVKRRVEEFSTWRRATSHDGPRRFPHSAGRAEDVHGCPTPSLPGRRLTHGGGMLLTRKLAAATLMAASFIPVGVTLPEPWIWPLAPPHPVVADFAAPATEYSAGHRGLDLAGTGSTPVFAVSDGVVSFAGVIVDRPVLSIRHVGDLTSSVEPVTAIVTAGDEVSRGQLVGQIAAGGHCSDRCLHLGARLHGRYVSPRLYLGGIPRAVLLPLAGDERSRPGVGVEVALFEPFGRHMGVNLGGAQAGVTEHLLNRPKVGPAVEQVGGRRVAQGVRAGRTVSGYIGEEGGDETVHGSHAQPPPRRAEEQCRDGRSRQPVREFRPRKSGAFSVQVGENGGLGGHAEWHHPLLLALSGHPHGEPVQVDVSGVEADEFGDAEP